MKSDPTHPEKQVTARRLQALRSAAEPGPVLIMTHANPDPDSLAAGAALATLFERAWGIQSHLGYTGLIARAENKAVLNLLTPGWVPVEQLGNLEAYPALALVDAQPGAGNEALFPGSTARKPQIVIDHHLTVQANLEGVTYLDIRPDVGATVSIVYQHLEAAGVQPDVRLATAIFYGIQSDTQGLSRGGTALDQEIYFKLVSSIDREKLAQVEQAVWPREDFQAFNCGLEASKIFGGVVISYLGALHRPDFLAEMADMLIRLENIRAALCMGYYAGVMYLSLRTVSSERDAGMLIQKTVSSIGKAGGHGTVAGGQVWLLERDTTEVAAELQQRFLEVMEEKSSAEPLLPTGS
jgi:nanoRNase/pAp phosphatase (c-di-AMP/oligoRNAs hydrolase)